jgi:hypothetical protein
MAVRVSCRAGLTFRLLLDCGDEDPAIEIVKRHMKAAAMNAALDLKRQDTGYDVELAVDYLVAYEEIP